MRILNAYSLKNFYNSRKGHIVHSVLEHQIRRFWSGVHPKKLLGYGYALPYLSPYHQENNYVFNLMPAQLGVHGWPSQGANLVGLHQESDLPLETNSVDFVLMMHGLEFLDDPEEAFTEVWRVMKSTGRLLIIVPNRMGFWARADWSPFGQGRPYSARQVENFLSDNLFVHERTTHALFSPPFKNQLFLRFARFFEKIGPYLYPALGGVHVIEATKQIYAGKHKGAKVGVLDKAKASVAVKPVSTNRV